jgi:tRNA(adenine34) deaminase
MQVITAATHYIGGKYLNDCTLYVTLEPCVMCAGALFWSQLGRLVYGAGDPKRGYHLLPENILHPKTVVESGLMEAECAALLKDFFRTKRERTP